MKIIDTFSEIMGCYRDKVFQMAYWEKYAESILPGLSDKIKKDTEGCDFQNDILPVVNYVAHNYDKLESAHRSFLLLTDGLQEKMRNILHTDPDVSVIFYLGLCSGAGWATELDGKPLVLLGVEKIIELSWYDKSDMAGLIYHELGHIWHNHMRKKTIEPFQNQALWQLYREGTAMYMEQLLMEDYNFYHQDDGMWLNFCQTNRNELFKAYLERVINGESTSDFFGDRNHYNGISDIGYYLGCETVKELAASRSLYQTANLTDTDILDQLKAIVG